MKKENNTYVMVVIIMVTFLFFHPSESPAVDLQWSGNIDFDYVHADAKNTDSSSDLILNEVALNLKAQINDKIESKTVIKYNGGKDDLLLDKAYVTVKKVAHLPLTLIAGKRTQPFGVFNSHLIYDPLTKDKYEIKSSGATLSYLPNDIVGLGFSFTVYSNKGALFTDAESENDLGNYIINASFTQKDLLTLTLSFDSEQGQDNRLNSLGASLSFIFRNITFDAEYIFALAGEKVFLPDNAAQNEDGEDQENAVISADPEESAFFLSAAYQLLPTLEVAARFEDYKDDIPGNQSFGSLKSIDELAGLDYRMSLGANYEVYENTTLRYEYRYSELEVDVQSPLLDYILRLNVEF